MDPKKTTDVPSTKPLPLSRTHSQSDSPFPTSLSPISPLLHYSPTSPPNSIPSTVPSSVSPHQSPFGRNASGPSTQFRSSPITPNVIPPNQFFSHQKSPSSVLPNQLRLNQITPGSNQFVPHQAYPPNTGSPPHFHPNQTSPNPIRQKTTIPNHAFPGRLSPNQFPISQPSGPSNRQSPSQFPSNQLPHPSQLSPNQWPTRTSFSDQGSPPQLPPNLSLSPNLVPSPHHNPSPSPISIPRQQFQPNFVPNVVQNPIPNVAPSAILNPVLNPFPNLPNAQHTTAPIIRQPGPPVAPTSGVSGTGGSPHINMYVAQVDRHFVGQPILFIEFLILLKELNLNQIEPKAFVERMGGVFGGRMDLLLGLGMFIPPQHRYLIYAKVEAAAMVQQNGESRPSTGPSPEIPLPAYRSRTTDYLVKVNEIVDSETWKLLRVVLERYYSNPSDTLIQGEAIDQLEHVLGGYPDLRKDCRILL